MLLGVWGACSPSHCGQGCKWVGAVRRTTVWRALKTAIVEFPRDPASPLALDPEKITILKDRFTPLFSGQHYWQHPRQHQPKCSSTEKRSHWPIKTLEHTQPSKTTEACRCQHQWTQRFSILSEVRERGIDHLQVESVNSHKWTNLETETDSQT